MNQKAYRNPYQQGNPFQNSGGYYRNAYKNPYQDYTNPYERAYKNPYANAQGNPYGWDGYRNDYDSY